MAGLTGLEELLAKIETAAEDARAATREAHAATKDLRKAKAEVEHLLTKAFDEHVDGIVKAGLDNYADTIGTAQRKAVEHVGKTFSDLCNIHLYGNVEGTGPSVFEQMVNTANAFRAKGLRP